jgi:hypothetical protein
MIPIETFPGKENGGGGEFTYIWYIVRTFINVTMYAHPAQLK